MDSNTTAQPLVSVVTVVYNGKDHVRDCINSVLNQTYKSIEYIIIDGGSKDGTVDIIKEYADRLGYWVSEKDNGITDAFNKGIAKCNGEIIGILNADDKYEPDAIAHVVNTYLQNGSTPGIYYGDAKIVYENGSYAYEMIPQIQNIWKYMAIYHPATLVAKKVYDEHGMYNTEYKLAMDAEFLHRCLDKKVPFFHVPHTLTNFFTGGASDKNMHASYREFYRSAKRFRPVLPSFYNYAKGVSKAYFFKTRLGTFLHGKRHIFAAFLSAKTK